MIGVNLHLPNYLKSRRKLNNENPSFACPDFWGSLQEDMGMMGQFTMK
jgi:hypothetical protein